MDLTQKTWSVNGRYKHWAPMSHLRLSKPALKAKQDIFRQIRRGDILVRVALRTALHATCTAAQRWHADPLRRHAGHRAQCKAVRSRRRAIQLMPRKEYLAQQHCTAALMNRLGPYGPGQNQPNPLVD